MAGVIPAAPGDRGGVRDDPARRRFELEAEGRLAYADYRVGEGVMEIPHVFADPALRGRGVAGRLMEGVLAAARARGLRVRPTCPYAAAYMRRHPEHADLLA
jgi:uncharacterized protein